MKVKATVEFIFDAHGTPEQISKCIRWQIETDLNAYFQNDDDTAQMESVEVKSLSYPLE